MTSIMLHQDNLEGGRDNRGEQHQHTDDLLPVVPQMRSSADHRGRGIAPDDCKAEHRHRVRDQVEQRRCQRQRERSVERVLAAPPQFFVASRTAGRRARVKLREPL
jgi:hypothetical protein